MSAKVVEIGIVLNDAQLKRKIKAQEKAWKKTKRAIISVKGAMVALVLGAAGRKFAAFMKESVKLTQDHVKAQMNLKVALRATGGAAGYTYEQLQLQAEHLGKTTTSTVREIMGAQAELATFVDIKGKMFQDVLQAALDIKTVFGADLPHIIVRLAKAFQNPTASLKALRRTGISFSNEFSDVIKKMQAAGKLSEAQVLIMRELKAQGIDKQAQELLKDGVFQIEQMKKAWDSFKIGVGSGIGASFDDLKSVILGTNDAMELLNQTTQDLISVDIQWLINGFTQMLTQVKAIFNVGQMITRLFHPITYIKALADDGSSIENFAAPFKTDLGDLADANALFQHARRKRIALETTIPIDMAIREGLRKSLALIVDAQSEQAEALSAQIKALTVKINSAR